MDTIIVEAHQITGMQRGAVAMEWAYEWVLPTPPHQPPWMLYAEHGASMIATPEWMEFYKPEPGGWWVLYPNGRAIYQPHEVFVKEKRRVGLHEFTTPWFLVGTGPG